MYHCTFSLRKLMRAAVCMWWDFTNERIIKHCINYNFNFSCTRVCFFCNIVPSLTFLSKMIVIYTCRYLFWSIHVSAR